VSGASSTAKQPATTSITRGDAVLAVPICACLMTSISTASPPLRCQLRPRLSERRGGRQATGGWTGGKADSADSGNVDTQKVMPSSRCLFASERMNYRFHPIHPRRWSSLKGKREGETGGGEEQRLYNSQRQLVQPEVELIVAVPVCVHECVPFRFGRPASPAAQPVRHSGRRSGGGGRWRRGGGWKNSQRQRVQQQVTPYWQCLFVSGYSRLDLPFLRHASVRLH
jgi:hypothetical protein